MNNNYYNQFNPGTLNAQYGQNPAMYNQAANVDVPWTDAKTAEDVKVLNTAVPEFTLVPDPIDLARSHCTHRDPVSKSFTVVTDPKDGHTTCTQCGTVFNFVQTDEAQLETAVGSVIDVLETTKLMDVTMSPEASRGFFEMSAYLKKLPKLYQSAANTFYKVSSPRNNPISGGYMSSNPFATINNAASGVMGYPQPGYGYNQQAPMMQQPVGYAPGGFAGYDPTRDPSVAQASHNPMERGYAQQMPMQPVYQQPMQQQAPVQQQVVEQPAQQAAPAQDNTIKTTKEFNI